MMKRITNLVSVLFTICLIFTACKNQKDEDRSGRLNILATTGMIEDAIKNIVKDSADVEALMGPGVDPHLYKATQGDLKKLQVANIIFYNGLHLEGKMTEIFHSLSRRKPVLPVSSGVPDEMLNSSEQFQGTYDPHIWFDVSIWKYAVEEISKNLQQIDTTNRGFYKQNTEEYLQKLDSLHKAVANEISKIPEEQKVLITAHDAFGYFGEAYDIEVRGLQGISTMSDYGLRDITDLVKFIIERNIKAIFVETSVSERSINAVIEGCREKGHEVRIGGSLYSDAMGEEGTFEGTYIGMVSSNVQKIVDALK